MTVSFSSFIQNQTISLNWDFDNSSGGGIFNIGSLTISDSTFAFNEAGGGGAVLSGGPLTIDNSTISYNRADPDYYSLGGGGISGNVLHARNTIIAGNTGGGPFGGPDLYGNLGSQGHNLIGNPSGGTGFDPTDLLNVYPMLGPLQDNGGPTKTMALQPGSPAIDAGDNTDAPDWDQRGPGFPRIVNGIIDIGAFEVQDGGNGPGRSASLYPRTVHLDAAALLPLAISPSPASFSNPAPANAQPQSTLARQQAAAVDQVFTSPNRTDTSLTLAETRLVVPVALDAQEQIATFLAWNDAAGDLINTP